MEEKKTLSEVIESVIDKENNSSFDSVYKAARRYLCNIFKSIDININSPQNKKYRISRNYIIGGKLEAIITNYLNNDKSFPTENQILECMKDEPSQLTSEVINIIKLYLKDNFTEDFICEWTYKINGKLEMLISRGYNRLNWHNSQIQKHTEDVERINTLINKIRENMVSVMFRAIQSMDDIYKIIFEMYYFVEKYLPDETPYLTENELIIIDFIRLNKILDNIYKDIQFKHTITLLSSEK